MEIVYQGIGIPAIYGKNAFCFPKDCLDNPEFIKWTFGSPKSRITVKDFRSTVRDIYLKTENDEGGYFATLFVGSYNFPVKITVACEYPIEVESNETNFDVETEIFITGCSEEKSDNIFYFHSSITRNEGIDDFEKSICKIVNRRMGNKPKTGCLEWHSFEVGNAFEMFR